ncbi:MAG: M20/M25/M40 family metallo-hydrolase [bacterium]
MSTDTDLSPDLETVRDDVEEDHLNLISDIVNISQIPAPTGDEEERAEFMGDRFHELGVDKIGRDNAGNVIAQVKERDVPAICLVAHLDTVFDRSVDHTAYVDDRTIRGPSVGDDSLGLATLLSMLRILDREQLGHVLLVATTGTEGEGNLRGSRHFLDKLRTEVQFALCLEGHRLGRLDHWSLGTDRFRISVRDEGGHVWRDSTGVNPIGVMGELISRLQAVSNNLAEQQSSTVLNLAEIEGGSAYNTVPYDCDLKVEARAEDEQSLEEIVDIVNKEVDAVGAEYPSHVSIEELSRRPAAPAR